MSGKSRFALALVGLLSFGCQSSSFKVGSPGGATGQGGQASQSSRGGSAAGPDAGTGAGGSAGTNSAASAGAGGGGALASSDRSAAGGADARDAGATIDAPLAGADGSMGGAASVAGSSGAAAGANGGTRADAGPGGTTALGGRSGGTGSSALGGTSSRVDAAGHDDETTFSVPQTAVRAVDMLFVIDNSPSMDPKQAALAAGFPAFMTAVQSSPIGLPDLHVGVVSTDMGAGGGEAGGNCAVVLGNQGILWGNDPSVDPSDQGNKYATTKNKVSPAGSPGCGLNAGARWIEDLLSSNGLDRSKNYLGSLPDVFSCLTSAVGVYGCGYEHTLQALRVALYPQPIVNPQNAGFLRRNAYLAIVIVTDEDDCSADPSSNDGMFQPRTLTDTASLRCAARGHVCNGLPIPTYDPAKGYTGTDPFVANFADCEAKDDADPHNLPLIRIRDIIDSVKQAKDRPDEQILVSGIIGWPQGSALEGVQYRIGKDSTSMPVEQQKLWDYMPICTVPTVKSADGNIFKAYGGLRLKRFIDGFGDNGRIYSICDGDLSPIMVQIGNRVSRAVGQKLWPACISNPLKDADANVLGTQPDCMVKDQLPCESPGTGSCLTTGYQETSLPQCLDSSGKRLDPTSPNLNSVLDDADHRPCWYLSYDKDPTTGCPNAPQGQKIAVLRRTGASPPPGSLLSLSCRTCPTLGDPRCTAP